MQYCLMIFKDGVRMKSIQYYFIAAILLLSCFGCDSERRTFLDSTIHSFRMHDLKGFNTALTQVSDVNMTFETYKWTLLHLIINEKSASDAEYFEKAIIIFKKHGGNLNSKDLYGKTPLHYCVIKKLSPNIYKSLVTHGADPSICDKIGLSPLDYLNEQRSMENK